MDASVLVALLFFVTFLAVIGFALLSKKKVEERQKDPDAEKSTLAADTPDYRH